MQEPPKKLGTDAYKGVRDFFPEDMAIQNHIFDIWRNICKKYGYQEYNASVLEPADLYRAKSGEEIVNEQTYTFTDRGEREVTLRPEMTPTVARMVAAKKRELAFPVRWFSIPNLFRYEQPQRGRLREHWQLNVDLFGVTGSAAEIEVISMAYDIVRAYGLKDTDFEIRLNSRATMDYMTQKILSLDPESAKKISRLIDKKDKVKPEWFEAAATEILGSQTTRFLTLLNSKNLEDFMVEIGGDESAVPGIKEIREVIAGLERLGITNTRFDQTLMRGFDYYTGIVFEVYDLNPQNRRAVFGGGRYDDLLSIFGSEKIPAFGFGSGDVIARDLMETYDTLPAPTNPAKIGICVIDENSIPYSLDLAQKLRERNINVYVDFSGKKLGTQISNAEKRGIAKIVCVGEEEIRTGKLKLKDLASGEEKEVIESEIS